MEDMPKPSTSSAADGSLLTESRTQMLSGNAVTPMIEGESPPLLGKGNDLTEISTTHREGTRDDELPEDIEGGHVLGFGDLKKELTYSEAVWDGGPSKEELTRWLKEKRRKGEITPEMFESVRKDIHRLFKPTRAK